MSSSNNNVTASSQDPLKVLQQRRASGHVQGASTSPHEESALHTSATMPILRRRAESDIAVPTGVRRASTFSWNPYGDGSVVQTHTGNTPPDTVEAMGESPESPDVAEAPPSRLTIHNNNNNNNNAVAQSGSSATSPILAGAKSPMDSSNNMSSSSGVTGTHQRTESRPQVPPRHPNSKGASPGTPPFATIVLPATLSSGPVPPAEESRSTLELDLGNSLRSLRRDDSSGVLSVNTSNGTPVLPQSVCRHFVGGRCNRRRCRFAHIGGLDGKGSGTEAPNEDKMDSPALVPSVRPPSPLL